MALASVASLHQNQQLIIISFDFGLQNTVQKSKLDNMITKNKMLLYSTPETYHRVYALP